MNIREKIDLRLLAILLAGIAAYFYIFLPVPYGWVYTDPDSIYIISSLSSVLGYPVFYVDHPGVTLHILGRLPIAIGALFTHGDDLIEKVLLNFSFYQYLFLWLMWTLCLFTSSVYIATFYQKEKGLASLAAVLIGLAAIVPPTLCDAIGVNADFGAFLFGILFATSLTWERDYKADWVSSLFYALMVYCKIIWAPLILLIFTVKKASHLRMLLMTAAWMFAIYLFFWDSRGLHAHLSTLRNFGTEEKVSSFGILLKFHARYFERYLLQSIYILLYMLLSLWLMVKKEYSARKGVGLLLLMAFLLEITILRPSKASIYTWMLFVVGLRVVNDALKARSHRFLKPAICTVFLSLFVMANIQIKKDILRRRAYAREGIEYKKNYEALILKCGMKNLFEYRVSPWHYFALGSDFFMGDGTSRHAYTSRIRSVLKKKYGIEEYKFCSLWDDSQTIRSYFQSADEKPLVVFTEPYLLLAKKGEENDLRKKFPVLKMRGISDVGDSGMRLWEMRPK